MEFAKEIDQNEFWIMINGVLFRNQTIWIIKQIKDGCPRHEEWRFRIADTIPMVKNDIRSDIWTSEHTRASIDFNASHFGKGNPVETTARLPNEVYTEFQALSIPRCIKYGFSISSRDLKTEEIVSELKIRCFSICWWLRCPPRETLEIWWNLRGGWSSKVKIHFVSRYKIT